MRKSLNEIAIIAAGQGAPQGDNNYSELGIPFVKAGNLSDLINGAPINSVQKVTEDVAKKYRLKLYPKGTILFAKSGMSCLKGYVYVLPIEAYVVNHLACVIPKDDISDYMKYYFTHNKPNQLIKDVAYPSIRLSDIGNLEVNLPESFLRQKTVNILDKVSFLIDTKKQQLEDYDQLIKSRFVDMFGDPILNDKDLTLVILKDLTTKISSGNTPKGGRQVYVDDGVMFFRSQNVWKNQIELKGITYIDEQTHKKMPKSSLKYGDILMTKTGRINTENSSLGRAAMYVGEDDRANVNGHVYLIRMNDIAVREFVLFIITTLEYRDYIRSVCVGGIDKRQLNKNHIENFPIILPSKKRQEDFVTLLKQVDKLKFEVQKSLNKTQTLFDSLMQEYFG